MPRWDQTLYCGGGRSARSWGVLEGMGLCKGGDRGTGHVGNYRKFSLGRLL